MLLRKRCQRGAILTEYIIILAFIGAIAASFSSNGGLVDVAGEAASKAKEEIIIALGGEPSKNKYYDAKMAAGSEQYKGLVDGIINGIFDIIVSKEIELDTVSQIYLHTNNEGQLDQLKISHKPLNGNLTQTYVYNLDPNLFLHDSKYSFVTGNTQFMMSGGNIIPQTPGDNYVQYTRISVYETDPETNKTTKLVGSYDGLTGEFTVKPKK